METQIVLKLVYNNEIHRIPFEVRQLSYEGTKIISKSLFPCLDEPFHFSYKDDEEESVNVSSEMELSEAVRLAYVTHKHLKLVIVKNTKLGSHKPHCPIPIRPLLNHLEQKLEECCKTFHAYGSWSCATLDSLYSKNCSIRKSEEIKGIQVRSWQQTQDIEENNSKQPYVQQEPLLTEILSKEPLLPKSESKNGEQLKPTTTITDEEPECLEPDDMDESLTDSQSSFEEMFHSDDEIVIIEKENPNSVYEHKLDKLSEMGFKDRQINLDLLIRENGSMVGTVKKLVGM